MNFDFEYMKPGDTIRSDEWNKVLDELVALRKYIEGMTRSVTLTALSSSINIAHKLGTDVPDDFNYGIDTIGLITMQYYIAKTTGKICKFGVHDCFDIIYYWSGAKGDSEALKITLEYIDGTVFTSEKLFIHEWSKLRPKGSKNPYIEYLQSPNQHLWYRYGLENSNPDKEIRYITFENINADSAVRIANVVQYISRIKPLNLPNKREK